MLPPLQQRWLEQLVGDLDVPDERAVTCHDCLQSQVFASSTKCCTFLPKLSNFLVGAVITEQPALIDPAPSQLRTPLGLIQGLDYQARYQAMLAAEQFGRDASMRCPYYAPASGQCGIWHAREAACSTWFCQPTHGLVGREFWTALRGLFDTIETTLARWCVRERGLELERAGHAGSLAWAHWWGREAEYYRDCAAAVDALDAGRLARLLPASVPALCESLSQARARLELPLVTLGRRSR